MYKYAGTISIYLHWKIKIYKLLFQRRLFSVDALLKLIFHKNKYHPAFYSIFQTEITLQATELSTMKSNSFSLRFRVSKEKFSAWRWESLIASVVFKFLLNVWKTGEIRELKLSGLYNKRSTNFYALRLLMKSTFESDFAVEAKNSIHSFLQALRQRHLSKCV